MRQLYLFSAFFAHFVLFTAFNQSSLFAQGSCATAVSVNCGSTVTGSTVGGTAPTFGTCGTTVGTGGAHWYTFTGDGNTWTAETVAGSNYDTKIWVFSGSCASLTCVTGNDDFSGTLSYVSFATTPGVTYYVIVGGFSSNEGTYFMDIDATPCVTSSECANALPISCGSTVTGSTVGDTPQTEGTCGTSAGTGGAHWYYFVGDGNTWTAETVAPSNYDTKIWVFTGNCGSLSCVTGDDDNGAGTLSLASWPTVNGQTYYVVVGGFSSNEGNYALNLTNDVSCTGGGGGGSCTGSNSITTLWGHNNGQSGIMWDMVALNPIRIQSLETNVDATGDYELYFRVGTHVGNETTPAAWTLIGTATGVTGNAAGTATPIPIPINVDVPTGCRVAFYLTFSNGTYMNYTNGTAVGNVYTSDANIQVMEGTGKAYSFGTNYTPRIFNGIIHYCPVSPAPATCGIVLPVQYLSINGYSTENGNVVSWMTENEQNSSHFVVERATELATSDTEGASNWEEIGRVDGAGNSEEAIHYRFIDEDTWQGQAFYRLVQFDLDGNSSTSGVIEISDREFTALEAEVYPQPATEKAWISLGTPEAGTYVIDLLTLDGRTLRTESHSLQQGSNTLELDVRELPAGIYLIQLLEVSTGRRSHLKLNKVN